MTTTTTTSTVRTADDGLAPQRAVTILTGPPLVAPLAAMQIMPEGMAMMMDWVRSRRPECLTSDQDHWRHLFPHAGTDGARALTDNELLVEFAGRKCYDSFGDKAGRKTNAEYIGHTQDGEVPHASILYHAKITLGLAGISRRMSHELIRNYVGADRNEEGSPSQESTRFTHHYGFFIAPPRRIAECTVPGFRTAMQAAYDSYCRYINTEVVVWMKDHDGQAPKGMDRKRIYEDAASELPGAAETSFVWTSNPMALAKMIRERSHATADLEFQRLAREIRAVCMHLWPNCFPQPWMQDSVTDRK